MTSHALESYLWGRILYRRVQRIAVVPWWVEIPPKLNVCMSLDFATRRRWLETSL